METGRSRGDTPPSDGERPDVVVVVLDCARQDTLLGGSDAAPGQGALEGLRDESWVFPRCIAAAPWTVPSHASLFTGLSAWQHGLHFRSRTRLPNGAATLAESLRARGYATASFSGNPLIGPITGLDRGFDECRWGGWHEMYLRGVPGHPNRIGTRTSGDSMATRVASSALFAPVANALQRRPNAVGAVLRLMAHRSRDAGDARAAGWIEPEFRQWVELTPQSTPLFGFINLIDAHEPYIGLAGGDPLVRGGRPDPRQDRRDWLSGRWCPRPEEWASLREMYRSTFGILSQRISEVVSTLRRAGRWRNTLFVLTSDHGQAFGEQGMLFHGLRNLESLVRVPLWVRVPDRSTPAPPLACWRSIASVRALVESYLDTQIDAPTGTGGPEARPEPPFVLADGLGEPFRCRLTPSRLEQLDRPALTGYWGSTKITYDLTTRSFSAVDLDRDPLEQDPRRVAETSGDSERYRGLRAAASAAFLHPPISEVGVDARLASWGYS